MDEYEEMVSGREGPNTPTPAPSWYNRKQARTVANNDCATRLLDYSLVPAPLTLNGSQQVAAFKSAFDL